MDAGPATDAYGQAQSEEQRPKRTYDEIVHEDGNSSTTGDDDDSDFEVFLSRYTKRMRRQQQSQDALHQPVVIPSTSQSVNKAKSKPKPSAGRSQRSTGRRQQPQESQQPMPGKSRSEHYDDIISQVAYANHTTNQSENVADDVSVLKAMVQALQGQVVALTQQVDFLMSIVGIDPTSKPTTSNPTNPGKQSYSSVVSRPIKGPLCDSLLAAVHSDLQLQKTRQRNVVVAGLPQGSTEFTDEQLFCELCRVEFNIDPSVIKTTRLGNKIEGRCQPLLVVLQEAEQAGLLLSLARSLRDSADTYTASSVFLSPHQTKAERQSAYESRCRRRQQSAARTTNQRQHPVNRIPSVAAAGDTGDHGNSHDDAAASGHCPVPVVPAKPKRQRTPASRPATGSSRRRRTPNQPSADSAVSHPSDGAAGVIGSTIEHIVQLVTSKLSKQPPTRCSSFPNVNVAAFNPRSAVDSAIVSAAGESSSK